MAAASEPLGERGRRSRWVSEAPGLAEEIATLDAELHVEREAVASVVADLTKPAAMAVPPGRALRHVAAIGVAGVRWAARNLVTDLAADLAPLRDPRSWLERSAVVVLRDQLSLLGPAGAEVARQLEWSGGMAPGLVTDELKARPVVAVPIAARDIAALREFEIEIDERSPALLATPLSELHRGRIVGGRDALVRVLRSNVTRDLADDVRVAAAALAPLEDAVPAVADMRPSLFVELIARVAAEATDLRHEALNAVELGLVVEELEVAGIDVARPIPGTIRADVLACESLEGRALADAVADVDTEKALTSLVGVTVEAALACGVFFADISPHNLLVLDGGGLAIAGAGTLGRLDVTKRRGLLKLLTSLLSGDVPGMIDAARLLDAVPPEADVTGLASELGSSEALRPMKLLMGGEQSLLDGLKEAMAIALRHRLRPPVEVGLFIRNLFGLRALSRMLPPGPGLMPALMPLVQRLPRLAADLA